MIKKSFLLRMATKVFRCNITGYLIEFILTDSKAIMNTIYSDYQNIKALLSLLRKSYDQLKLDGIKKITQSVTIDDYNNYLCHETTWVIIDENKLYGTYTIECEIDDFLYNLGKSIGVDMK